MSAAALGARARPLPDGAGSWAASIACASSAGGALALAPPFLALALAASDIISPTPVQMRTAIKHLPTNMARRRIAAGLSLAPAPERANPVFGARDSGPEDVIEHCHGQLLVFLKE